MDFAWTEREQELKASLQKFIDKGIEPHMTGWYRNNEIPRQFFTKMAEEGFFGYIESEGRWVEDSAAIR
jgi:alkylation response protein AidB-like acyl-CoA dehydrogenase